MAHKNDYQIQKQLDKPQTWFCKYYPARIRNVGDKEIADRQLVFDFKDGRAYEEVAQRTAENMLTLYGKGCVNIVFAPVPASTSESNELRYKAFCHRVCELTGAENGYEHVRVCGERKTIHDNRKNEDEVRKANVVEFDEPFFDNKMVLVFDDVITKGLLSSTKKPSKEQIVTETTPAPPVSVSETTEVPVHCNFLINKSIHTRMKYLAIKKGMSLRDIVNEAMTEYLKRHDT